MLENLLTGLAPLMNFLNHKITTTVMAGGLIVTAKSSDSVKGLADITPGEIFTHDLSALAWTMLIGTAWIVFQFAREAAKGIIWLSKAISDWRAARAKADGGV